MKILTKFPKTCVAIMATANLHPQRRRLSQPTQATGTRDSAKRCKFFVSVRINAPNTVKSTALPDQGCSRKRCHYAAK
jgi:hypothetical protein